MNYICIPFMKDFIYNDEIQEFTIKYNSLKDNYLDLVQFIEAYSDRRINIELLNTGVDGDIFVPLLKINPEIYLKLNEGHITRAIEFARKGLRFFFSLQCASWDSFNSLIFAGVSDIYITNELGFNLKQIQKKLLGKDIRVRAIVNFAQMADPFGNNSKIKAFFIRPEDLDYYSQYIDTFEFLANNQTSYEVFYKVYIKDKCWDGNLSEIILNLDMDIDSRTIMKDFAPFRVNCGKRCFHDSPCQLCERVVSLAEALASKGLIFTTEYPDIDNLT